jgi:predicted dehydrogenase
MTEELKKGLSRRQFLRSVALSGIAAGIAPTLIPSGVLAAPGRPGANDRIGIAVIGPGRQGGGLLGSAGKSPEARIVAMADVNLKRARAAAAAYRAEVYKDYRKLLERKDVDAVITATPEHWRALICIHACQAGKDIYAEKPMTLTIHEGRLMVEAARKYQRVFQCGSQQRSQVENHVGCQLVRSGALGKVTRVIGNNYPSPWLCALPAHPVPDELDWDMWCGPTEPVAFNADLYAPRAKPGWLSFRPYSGGEMTGWGAHGLDQVQWALGMDNSGPVEIWTEGERFNPPTYTEPETSARGNKLCSVPTIFYRYANGVVLELANGPTGGAIFLGEKGKLTIDRGKCVSDPPELAAVPLQRAIQEAVDRAHARKSSAGDPEPPPSPLVKTASQPPVATPPLNGGHMQNWFDCIRTRSKPIADVETGHRSATVCHLGNIARWTGRRLHWDPIKEVFLDDPEANQYLDRVRRKPYELPEKV